MSTSLDDLANQLLAQTTVSPQPSFGGLQAPPDPGQIQALLSKVRQAQFLQQAQQPTPGEYGYLHDAGRAGMVSVGQQLGNLFSQYAFPQAASAPGAPAQLPQAQSSAARMPLGAQPSGDDSDTSSIPQQQPKQLPQQAIGQAIRKGQAAYAAMINSGLDPDVAQLHTFSLLASQGVPGVEAKLLEAQQTVLKNNATRQESGKNAAQAANFGNESNNRDARLSFEQSQANYTPRPDLSNSEYIAQQVGGPNGRVVFEKRGDKMPPAPPTAAQDSARDLIAQKIANYDLQLGTAVGRGGADLRQDYLQRVLAVNPDFDEKNWKQSNDALKAFGPSGTQGQMILKTQNAMNHLAALKEYGDALQTGDTNIINRAQNLLSQQLGGIPITTYNAVAPIVANEVSSGLVKGGGGQEERQERVQALAAQLSGPQRNAAIDGMRSLLGAQYQNNRNLYERTTLRHDFDKRFPVAGGFPAPPGTRSPSSDSAGGPPPTNAQGWTLHKDARGNMAYVSPDGKQAQEVK